MKHIDDETGELFTLDDSSELLADLSAHWDAACRHAEKQVMRVYVANGAVQLREVCQDCGERIGSAIKKSAALADCKEDDGDLAERYAEKRKAELNAIYQRHIKQQKASASGYRDKYQAYLSSEVWAHKRSLVLRRANTLCEGCLERPATQVHHLSYQHVVYELLYELVAICDDCHDRAHTYQAVSKLEHEQLPCSACRMGGWSEDGGSFCLKFDMSTGAALSKSGPCGPNASQLEPLK